ncbi:WXG100 family type VII secretion target [Micromonospora sp. NPDC047548]|uniref:WXG100 family type VII secretion target n=1 Tax=Micromonospora sp. NPDC047548 TaxID=3155624 RepID=UPI0033C435EC
MSNYSFNFQVADYTLDGMNAINTQIRQALDSLQATAESSLAEWTGDAREHYTVAKAAWNTAAQQMTVHLETARSTLLNISDNYGTTEQRARQIWENSRG